MKPTQVAMMCKFGKKQYSHNTSKACNVVESNCVINLNISGGKGRMTRITTNGLRMGSFQVRIVGRGRVPRLVGLDFRCCLRELINNTSGDVTDAQAHSACFIQHRSLRQFKYELLWQYLKFVSSPLAEICECKTKKKF